MDDRKHLAQIKTRYIIKTISQHDIEWLIYQVEQAIVGQGTSQPETESLPIPERIAGAPSIVGQKEKPQDDNRTKK